VSAYDRRRRRRNPWRGRLAWALLFVVVFALGVALGQALEDSPTPSTTNTQDRTYTLPPPAATVTVTAP
jgi:hypothetical protein